jgi:phosphoribosylamine-glycine ligase
VEVVLELASKSMWMLFCFVASGKRTVKPIIDGFQKDGIYKGSVSIGLINENEPIVIEYNEWEILKQSCGSKIKTDLVELFLLLPMKSWIKLS